MRTTHYVVEDLSSGAADHVRFTVLSAVPGSFSFCLPGWGSKASDSSAAVATDELSCDVEDSGSEAFSLSIADGSIGGSTGLSLKLSVARSCR